MLTSGNDVKPRRNGARPAEYVRVRGAREHDLENVEQQTSG